MQEIQWSTYVPQQKQRKALAISISKKSGKITLGKEVLCQIPDVELYKYCEILSGTRNDKLEQVRLILKQTMDDNSFVLSKTKNRNGKLQTLYIYALDLASQIFDELNTEKATIRRVPEIKKENPDVYVTFTVNENV